MVADSTLGAPIAMTTTSKAAISLTTFHIEIVSVLSRPPRRRAVLNRPQT